MLISTAIVLLAGYIGYSMVRTTVINAEKWKEKANKELERQDVIKPTRGDILAADGSVLATNIDYYTMRIDFKASKFSETKFRESLDSLCDTLAVYYPIHNKKGWKDVFEAELKKPDSLRSSHFTLLRDLSYAQSEAVRDFPYFRRSRNPNRTGLTCDVITRRCYPYGEMARRSIGRVGQTKECSDVHGVSGLESALDKLLYGTPGLYKKVPLTHNIVNWTDVPAIKGSTLTTTIDISLQDIMENELADNLRNLNAQWGTAILMEVSTGDIKAIANLERDKNGNYTESINHAVQERFEPGSVMKAISMVIALEDGFTKNPDNEFYHIQPFVFGGGKAITDTHYTPDHQLPVSRFLEYSSNIGMTKLVAHHYYDNPNGFRERIRELGLLEPFETGIEGECVPYFPQLDIKSGGRTTLGRQTYGYASQISPLYICAFYNAIANDGQFVRPRIISKITTEKGDSDIDVTYVRKQMCSPRTARIVREMLHKVVYGQGGTARALQDKQIDIAGKTGTSKIAFELSPEDIAKLKVDPNDPTVVRVSGYEEGAYRYAFCGFFPYNEPKYTCMVLISRPDPNFRPRNAAVISGKVLLNVAKRMYAKGMLGDGPDYHEDVDANRTEIPTLYATHNAERHQKLVQVLSSKAVHLAKPADYPESTIPDVTGLGLREALSAIEHAGYNIAFEGEGTVISQVPAGGTEATPGTSVKLILRKK